MVQGVERCSWWKGISLKLLYSCRAAFALACDWEGTGSDQVLLWNNFETAPSLYRSIQHLLDNMEEDEEQLITSGAGALLATCLEDRVSEGDDEWRALQEEVGEYSRTIAREYINKSNGKERNETTTIARKFTRVSK